MDLSKEIFITASTDLENILDFLEINEILADKICLNDFGDGLNAIVFQAIVMSTPSKIEKPGSYFNTRKGSLTGKDIVDYQKLKNSTIPEGTKLLIEGLFKLLDKYSRKIPQFDIEGLKQAILQVVDDYQPVVVE